MRILFLCNRHIDRMVIGGGGVTEFVFQLPPALKTIGVETIIYSAHPKPTDELIGPIMLPNGIKSYSGRFAKPGYWTRKKSLKAVIQLCKQEQIDVIHAQGVYNSGFLARQIHRHTGIPYIVTSHGDILPVNSERIQRRRVQRRCKAILRDATGVTHLIPLMADAAHKIFDTRSKSSLIGNGIHVSEWQPYLNLPEQNFILGIGRLVPEKGFHILIEAYAKLLKLGVKTSLVIAGSGAEEIALQTQAKRFGLNVVTNLQNIAEIPAESVVFTGYVQGQLKKQLIASCKIITFPTQPTQWEEAFGIVQIEAMAAGKPLIASDTNATRYLQEFGLQARLVTPDNTQEWAEQIAALLQDETVRNSMSKLNLVNVKTFDWSIIANQYRTAYQTVCSVTKSLAYKTAASIAD